MKHICFLFALLLTTSIAVGQSLTFGLKTIYGSCVDPCGGSITVVNVVGTPPFIYKWPNGEESPTPTLYDLCPGNYTVTVTDSKGVTGTQSTSLVFAGFFGPVGVSLTPACCYGTCTGKIDVGFSGGALPYTYLWSNGATTEDLINCAGTYTVTVTDAGGCTKTTSATINQPPALDLVAAVTNKNATGAPGAVDLTVTGGVPPYKYIWSTGSVQEDLFSIYSAGTYCVTVSDAKGCTTANCATVQQSNDPTSTFSISAQVQNTCGTGTGNCTGSIKAFVSGATTSYNYDWTGPNGFTSTQNPITNLCAGTYTFVVTPLNGGGSIKSASFTVFPSGSSEPLTILSSNPAFCNATAGTGGKCEQLCPNAKVTYYIDPLKASCSSSPSPAASYVWSVEGAESWSVIPDTKGVFVVWGKSGSGSISVSQSGSQCVISDDYCVNILEAPTAKFSTTPALAAPSDSILQVCKGQSVFFKNNSLAADLYEWSFSDDASISTEQSPKHTYHQPGLFRVRLIARTNCLCADTSWLRVRVLDSETPLLDCVSTICPGETVTYSTSSKCVGYEWSVSPNGVIIGGGGPLNDSLTVRWLKGPDGTLSLQAIGCGGNVCPARVVVQVPILSDEAEIRGPELVCPDAEELYQLTPFDGAFYKWTLDALDGVLLEGQGTARVVVKWAQSGFAKRPLVVEYYNCYLGCSGRDTIWVKVSPQFGVVGPVQACDKSSANFSTKTFDNQNITCAWTLYAPDGTVANYFISPNQKYTATFGFGPGTYRLVAVPVAADHDKTCTAEAEWKVLVQANPQKPTGISGQTVFCPGQSLTFKAEGVHPANDVRWQALLSTTPVDGGTGNPKNFSFTGGAGQRWVSAYQITTDALGCKSDSTRLFVKELTGVTVSGPDEVCLNGLATYTAPLYQGFDYQWVIKPATAGVIVKGAQTNTLEVQWV